MSEEMKKEIEKVVATAKEIKYGGLMHQFTYDRLVSELVERAVKLEEKMK